MEIQEKQENLALGILGALLGGILGGVSIILIGQLGIISAISGVVLAFCTLKGYELLGKKLSKQGILVCLVVLLVMPYLADRLNWTLAIMQEYQWLFGDAFLYVHEVVEDTDNVQNYWKDLLFTYAFTAMGAFGIVKQAFKQKKED